jgi:carbamoyl-phosphate synthase large subunit
MIAKKLNDLGFGIYATKGTSEALNHNDISAKLVNRIGEGRPDVMDLIKNGQVSLIINTPSGKKPKQDEVSIRAGAYTHLIPLITTVSGAQAAVAGIEAVKKHELKVKPIQDYI